MNTKLSPIKEILGKKNATLGTLVAQANSHLQLEKQLARHLSPQLYSHVKIAKWRDGELVLSMPQGSLFTRTRYLLPDLENQLRQDPIFKHLKKIRLIAEVPQRRPTAQKRASHSLDTKHHLQALRSALRDIKEN